MSSQKSQKDFESKPTEIRQKRLKKESERMIINVVDAHQNIKTIINNNQHNSLLLSNFIHEKNTDSDEHNIIKSNCEVRMDTTDQYKSSNKVQKTSDTGNKKSDHSDLKCDSNEVSNAKVLKKCRRSGSVNKRLKGFIESENPKKQRLSGRKTVKFQTCNPKD